ncbi:hypothetical protein WJX84_003477 [Apatococcus fuscideae]|uniref:Protein ENHANCED DISEASE RESISTANCE 2 C-terminal domain-containing protein n=1 Tax=Apatococcus fuscideae TaxID=2026836 RepID=A0AAW1RVA0_9CHLO
MSSPRWTGLPAASPPPPPWWNWFAPVSGTVYGGGWTISPMRPELQTEGHVAECLVTLVIRADLNGWLGTGHSDSWGPARWVATCIRNAFIEPLLMSIISVRELVEHDKFVPPAHPPHGSASGHLSCLQPCRSAEANGQRGAGSAGMLGQLDKEYWSCPGDSGLRIRGAHYLQDKKKIPAAGPVFSLVAADLIETPRPMTHIAQHLPSLRHSSAGFSFVWQVMIPGPPYLSLISTWAVDVPEGQRSDGLLDTSHLTSTPFDRCLARFLDGTDKDRNSMFKLIPNVAKGSWVIKQSVGHSPVLLGNKLKTHYFRTDRYMEVDVDVASSSAANTVVKLVQGATRHLVVDMAILLEGHTEDELPEVLLGTIRYSQLDMRKSQRLDLDEQVVSSSAG